MPLEGLTKPLLDDDGVCVDAPRTGGAGVGDADGLTRLDQGASGVDEAGADVHRPAAIAWRPGCGGPGGGSQPGTASTRNLDQSTKSGPVPYTMR